MFEGQSPTALAADSTRLGHYFPVPGNPKSFPPSQYLTDVFPVFASCSENVICCLEGEKEHRKDRNKNNYDGNYHVWLDNFLRWHFAFYGPAASTIHGFFSTWGGGDGYKT